MAKKTFRNGLSSLIRDTRKETETNEPVQQTAHLIEEYEKDIEHLQAMLDLQQKELFKWRTGKLTLQQFEDSLKKHQLRYNSELNQIEKI